MSGHDEHQAADVPATPAPTVDEPTRPATGQPGSRSGHLEPGMAYVDRGEASAVDAARARPPMDAEERAVVYDAIGDTAARLARPDPGPAPDGHRWEAHPSLNWKTIVGADEPGRRCRWGVPACGRPAVAALNRGRHRHHAPYGTSDSWWAYCGDHLYGNWIEGGVVMHWRLVEVPS